MVLQDSKLVLTLILVTVSLIAIYSFSWQRTLLVVSATVFLSTIGIAGTLYVDACGATLTDAIGLTDNSSTQDNLSNCLVVGGSLLATSYASVSITIFGLAAGWFYNGIAASVSDNSTTNLGDSVKK